MKSNIEKSCCNNESNPVFWNPYNKAVQCHACGHVYVKAGKFKYFLNRFFKF